MASQLAPTGYAAAPRLNYRYLDDQILLDTEGAYTIVSIPTITWTMGTPAEKQRVLASAVRALGNVPRGGKHHSRLITTSYPFDATAWHDDLLAQTVERGQPTLGLRPYLADMRDALNGAEWPIKTVYLVVRLGDRANWDGFLGRLRRTMQRTRAALDLQDEMPGTEEIRFWQDQASGLRATLASSNLRARPVGRRETETLLLHLTHPGLPIPDTFATSPQTYGPGELRTLCGGEVTLTDLGKVGKYAYRCLRHDTAMGTSYQVNLVLSQGPEDILFPSTRWLDLASQLPFAVTTSVGFEIEEATTTSKDADKAERHIEEQFYTDAEAGVATELSVQQKAEQVRQLKYLVRHHRLPFVKMRALFSVADTDKAELRDKVRETIRYYREQGGFTLDAPPANQRFWFYEGLPCGVAGDADYQRRVSLDYLASGMPHLFPSVGEGTGLYQGFTHTEAGGRGGPVFVDHLAYANVAGIAPTEAVPGEPGGGKALAVDTPIPTPSGWATMGDLTVGDRVYDETGALATVTYATPVMHDHACFEVAFCGGSTLVADADHRWLVHPRPAARAAETPPGRGGDRAAGRLLLALVPALAHADPDQVETIAELRKELGGSTLRWVTASAGLDPVETRTPVRWNGKLGAPVPAFRRRDLIRAVLDQLPHTPDRPFPCIMTTAELAALLDSDSTGFDIKVAGPVGGRVEDLPVPPVLLGLALGVSPRTEPFTVRSTDTLTAFADGGYRLHPDSGGRETTYRFDDDDAVLLAAARIDGRWRIPPIYQRASLGQRYDLLDALVDSAGEPARDGRCVLVIGQADLANDVHELVTGLGHKAEVTDDDGCALVTFTPRDAVFRTGRRAHLQTEPAADTVTFRQITAVQAVASVPVRCITVDSPSRLYLAGRDFVATHNTVSRGLKPVWEDALRGVTQAVWDPKGDYLVLKYHALELGLDPDRIHTINILNAAPGMLDPAALAETTEERGPLMREVLLRLAPDLFVASSPHAADIGDVVRQAVDVAIGQDPTSVHLTRVIDVLTEWEQLEERPGDINHENKRRWSGTLARRYRTVASHPMGKLIFASERAVFRISAGHTVIFSTLGMKTPEPGTLPEQMSESELLSDVIFGLMADYTWNLMGRLPVELRKAITWDEWHVNKENPRAKILVDRIGRLGRSRNTFLRLISQSAGDFPPGFISAVWAFGVRSRTEAEKTCELLGVEPSPENTALIMDLVGAKGRCVVRDRDGRIGLVQVEFLYDRILDYFDTNPERDPSKMRRIVAELFGDEAAKARAAIEEQARAELKALQADNADTRLQTGPATERRDA